LSFSPLGAQTGAMNPLGTMHISLFSVHMSLPLSRICFRSALFFYCCRRLGAGSRLPSVCLRCRFPGPTSLGSPISHPIPTASSGSPLPTPMSSPLLACPSNHSMPHALFATAHSFKSLLSYSPTCAHATRGYVQTDFRDQCGLKRSSHLN
jgi:hypothetical protein